MKNLLICTILFLSTIASSQSLEIGVIGGVSFYNGDLSSDKASDYFRVMRPMGGILGRINYHKNFSVRVGLTVGQLYGDDVYGENQYRNLNFKTTLVEGSVIGEWNIFWLRYGKTGLAPYLFGGASVYHFNPKTEFQGQTYKLRDIGTEGQGLQGHNAPYSLTQIAIPFGIGVKIGINESWTLGLEFGARKLFTDYLDDVSSTLLDYQELRKGSGDLAAALSYRTTEVTDEEFTYERGSDYKDWYYMAGFTLSYRFGAGDSGIPKGGSGKNGKCYDF